MRDAAHAPAGSASPCRCRGAHALYLAAPETLSPYPTEDLLDRYLPDVPRRAPLPGRRVPIDTSAAAALLGFTAPTPFDITPAELGGTP